MEVLIVDDEPLIHELLAAVVRKAFGEVNVVEARDLETAFQRLAHHGAPDLALLDLGLPGQRGLESLKRFRWKFPHVPVVVVSAIEDAKSDPPRPRLRRARLHPEDPDRRRRWCRR